MKATALRIGVTMREHRAASGELHDAVAASWSAFIEWAFPEATWVAIPNVGAGAAAMARDLGLDAVILTGGDDIGASERRDATEFALLEWARRDGVPVLGICRGAQLMWHALGAPVVELEDHVAMRHDLTWADDATAYRPNDEASDVNSFHRWGLYAAIAPVSITVLATAVDGTVEAFKHVERRWLALMWHPERETPFVKTDRALVRAHFGIERAQREEHAA